MNILRQKDNYDTIIIGGGIIGLSIAYHLAKEKNRVLILEKNICGRGTTWAAAGMLSAVNELEFKETAMLQLMVESLNMYPSFIEELGEDVDLRRDGTLTVGLDEDDKAYMKRVYEYQKELGLNSQWIEGDTLRNCEPYLSPNIEFGFFCSSDIQLDNHLLAKALKKKCLLMGAEIQEHEEVLSLLKEKDYTIGVETKSGRYFSENVVAANGIWKIGEEKFPFKIQPVRGQVVELFVPQEKFLNKIIRIENKKLGWAYVIPKSNRIVCGGTAEQMGMDKSTTAGGVMDILRKCYALVPGIYDLKIKNIYAGLRPATSDFKPVIGEIHLKNLFIANGMFRHGILLAPITGKIISEMILKDSYPEKYSEFSPKRFYEMKAS